jgi:hypothetical protein
MTTGTWQNQMTEVERVETVTQEPIKVLTIYSGNLLYNRSKFQTLSVVINTGILTYSGTDIDGKRVSGASKDWTSYSIENHRYDTWEKKWLNI